MSKQVSYVLIAAAVSSAAMFGCKDDPAPQPDQGNAAGSEAPANTLTPADSAGTAMARVDAETTKRNRIEACYFGALGIALTRDAYMASVKDAEPSAEHLPKFGEFPEQKAIEERQKAAEEKRKEKSAEAKERGDKGGEKPADDTKALSPSGSGSGKPMGRVPREGQATNIPFLRHLRACTHAKSGTQAPMEGLDEALKEFEAYATKVHQELVKATRYYSRDAYTKDEFKEGKTLHASLSELLPQFEDKRAALAKALETWRAASKDWKPKDELDEAAKLSYDAVYKARDLTLMFLAEKRDVEAIKKAIEELKELEGKLNAIRESDKKAPHPKVFGPKLTDFIKAAEEAAALPADAALTPAQFYPVTSNVALMFELHQRGLEQLLRQKSSRRPLKMVNPGGADDANASQRMRMRPE